MKWKLGVGEGERLTKYPYFGVEAGPMGRGWTAPGWYLNAACIVGGIMIRGFWRHDCYKELQTGFYWIDVEVWFLRFVWFRIGVPVWFWKPKRVTWREYHGVYQRSRK